MPAPGKRNNSTGDAVEAANSKPPSGAVKTLMDFGPIHKTSMDLDPRESRKSRESKVRFYVFTF